MNSEVHMNIRTSAVGIVLAIVGLIAPLQSSAQWVLLEKDADAKVRGGFDALYNLRYEQADSLFSDLTRTQPDHPAGFFLLALVDWWRIVPNLDDNVRLERYSDSFHARLDNVIEISDVRLESNPKDIVGLFFKGAALGYQARLKILNSTGTAALTQWPSAALDGKEALDILRDAQALAPGNSDILLGSGLFMYMSAALPEQYPAARPVLGFLPPGDRQIGLNMLRISAKKAAYASVEAKYALLEVLHGFEKNYSEALGIAQELNAKYPGNPVFYRYLAKSYYMTSDFVNADTAYSTIIRRVLAREKGYEMTMARQALYYLGDIRMRTGSFESSAKHFQQAIEQSKRLDASEETSWRVLSVLKLGQVYDLLGRRPEALKQYREVLDLDDHGSSHQKAREFLAKPYVR